MRRGGDLDQAQITRQYSLRIDYGDGGATHALIYSNLNNSALNDHN